MLKQSALLGLLIVAFTLSVKSYAQKSSPAQTGEEILQDFKDVSGCSERVWPSYSLSNHHLLILNDDRAEQLALDVKAKTVYKILLSDLDNPPDPQTSYSFFKSNGRNWIALNEDLGQYTQYPHFTFGFGAHEAFHHVGQEGWTGTWGARGEHIPIQWEPRYARAMLDENLRQAFFNPKLRTLHLRQAKYWYNEWRKLAPEEIDATTDGYEGTASYAEYISVALVTNGCDATEAKLRESLVERVQSLDPLLKLAGNAEFDIEGYSIGASAAYLLRFDRNIKDWQARVSKGETPVDILLKDIVYQKQKADPKQVELFKQTARDKQAQVDKVLGPVQKTLAQKDGVIVSIPRDWLGSGAISFKGFYVDSANGYSYSVLAQELGFKNGQNQIDSTDGAVGVSFLNETGSCGGAWNFVVAKSELQENAGVYTIQNPGITGVLRGELKTDQGGQQWLCGGVGTLYSDFQRFQKSLKSNLGNRIDELKLNHMPNDLNKRGL